MQAAETNGKANGKTSTSRGERASLKQHTTPEAAVFRLERALSPIAPELGAAWIASYTTSLRSRALRIGGAMLGVPGRALGTNPTTRTRMTWMGLEGMSRDRIEVLGEQFARERILPRLRERSMQLLADAKKRGAHIVIISSSISEIASHIARELGADTLHCNHLEYRAAGRAGAGFERATGRLEEPIVHGTSAAKWLKSWAQDNGVDLQQSFAYGGLCEDIALLSGVGQPCAISPDRALRTSADSLGWPTIS